MMMHRFYQGKLESRWSIFSTGGTSLSGGQFQIFEFNRASNSLTSVAGSLTDAVYSVNWSPDGQYLAVSDGNSSGFAIFTGLQLSIAKRD